jgi:hypothetical protein
LSLSPYSSADLSSHGSVAWGLQRGKVGSLLWSLAQRCGPSGLAPIRPHVNLLCWLSLPRPTKEWPYDLLGPWAFREVFYSSSGPGDICPPQQLTMCTVEPSDSDTIEPLSMIWSLTTTIVSALANHWVCLHSTPTIGSIRLSISLFGTFPHNCWTMSQWSDAY